MDHADCYPDIFEELVRLRNSGGRAVLVTVVSVKGSTPRQAGARMIVYSDGRICGTVGGGVREGDIIRAARDLFTSGAPRLLEVDFTEGLRTGSGPVCGGIMQVFMEPVEPRRRAVISGAGHIGYYLHRILSLLDYRVSVIDPRPELNSADRFPGATLLLRDFAAGIDDLDLGPLDAVILVGPGHDADRALLPSALRSGAGYIGMIGSRRKIKEVYERLGKEAGIDLQTFERVRAPIGLEIGSESPAEIAVAIAAEIIKLAKS